MHPPNPIVSLTIFFMKASFCNLLFKRIWPIKTIKSANRVANIHSFSQICEQRETHTEKQYDLFTIPFHLSSWEEDNYDLHVYEWLNLQDTA